MNNNKQDEELTREIFNSVNESFAKVQSGLTLIYRQTARVIAAKAAPQYVDEYREMGQNMGRCFIEFNNLIAVMQAIALQWDNDGENKTGL